MSDPDRVIPISHSRPLHDAVDEAAAIAVLRSQMSAAGGLAEHLARLAAERYGGSYAAAAPSGTLAMVGALRSLQVCSGDRVVVPTYVCPEVLDAVLYLGAEPVLCDIDSRTYAPSMRTVAAVAGEGVRAVVVPHMFGIPAAVDEIVDFGIPVVEDIAQGLGAVLRDRPAGAWGAATVLSLKAIKMISAGEGGVVVVRDPEAAECLAALRLRKDPRHASFHFGLSDLAAAVALSQWERLPDFMESRRLLAERYRVGLTEVEAFGIELPSNDPGRSWFRFPLRLPSGIDPADLIFDLASRGVHVRQPVDGLLHRHLGLPAVDFPVAEEAFARTISLPLYPALTDRQQELVIRHFSDAVRGRMRSIGRGA